MRGLVGHLELTAVADSHGETQLRRQSFAAPVHISKPHRDNGWLVVNMASPSPGLLAGDRVEVDVRVEPGARLLLTAPSASRIHTMGEGESATLTQRFHVAAGAALDVWPEYVIPQTEATYIQASHIKIAEGGALIWTESIAPGRTARGEVFAFREMRVSTDIVWKERLLLRERYRTGREHSAIRALRFRFPQAYYASIVCICPGPKQTAVTLRELSTRTALDGSWVGLSQIGEGAFVAKLVAPDSPTLRSLTASVRGVFYSVSGLPLPNPRRVTGELAA